MNKLITLLIGFTFTLLSACSTNTPVAKNQAGTLSKESVVIVKQGTVTSVRKVTIMGKRGNAAGTVGSITGSILGSSGTVAGSILGSMIGGAIGTEADKELSKRKGLEIAILLSSGERVVVTQLAKISFKKGDKVQLMMQENQARVSHLDSNS